ncbi:MAG: GNAT family N-acetyltransferase [Candidatus Lokiarchaeota archaeon]
MPINKSIVKSIETINDFLLKFEDLLSQDYSLEEGIKLNFELSFYKHNSEKPSYLYLAKPKDARRIAYLYNSVYKGKYPYREMQDPDEVLKLIKSRKYNWLLYKDTSGEIFGTMGFYLELENKKAYLFGYVIDKKYWGKTNNLKPFIGSLIVLWRMYKNKIFLWYSETRTAHNKAQLGQIIVGLKPIAFFPNKDLFYGKYESEFLHVIYDKKLLNQFRSNKTPKVIRQVLNCYLFANKFYRLGKPIIRNPKIEVNRYDISSLDSKYVERVEMKFNVYEKIKLYFKNTTSYFQFTYNRENNSAENTKYSVNNLEELYFFLSKLKDIIALKRIRYFQCFVSSYNPDHQKLFLEYDFRPYGYIPGWNYNKKINLFEDCVVFIKIEGEINENLHLLPQTKKLLKTLNCLN